ncbi:polyamine ABC transporter substrate-binding protein [Acuticoccus mangrovi]|uniref:Putrescine-binding periplasmic protein n=1 Tax=Acuticoccus mangrovi TaxID=2796142 RepID=A0A934ISE4_9HYPH|nr:polyamine ABC transporter substrate-binding protein [Acuticoccus mangrovi]MBJ3777845.1 polyamine ABC transporter substrate-binding protein [Acuticoccus mangrovi]
MFARLAVAASLTALLVAPAAGQEVVNVYNWSDYIDESVLGDFTAETGIEVRYDVFDSNEFVEAKLLAGSTGYDVVVPTAYFLSRQIRAGVFAPLDKSKLSNLGNLWDKITKETATYDPGLEYAIPYMWGTTGLGYVEEKILERMPDAPVDSWDMLFDPDVVSKFADCGIHVLDAQSDVLPIAMNYLGLDPNSKDPNDIRAGAELVAKIRPFVQKFDSSEYINALANGDICLAVGWSGDVLQARDRADEADNGVTVVYSIPKEGAPMWFDMMAIPADAPHMDNALKFIDFILRPEVIAKATNYVNYANANAASREFVDEGVLGDPAVYPPDEVQETLFTTTELPPRVQRVATREWTRIKTGQ